MNWSSETSPGTSLATQNVIQIWKELLRKNGLRIANEALGLERADSIRRGELESILAVENRQSLGIDHPTCSENCRINIGDWIVVVEQRCFFAAQVLVRFLYWLRRCQ